MQPCGRPPNILQTIGLSSFRIASFFLSILYHTLCRLSRGFKKLFSNCEICTKICAFVLHADKHEYSIYRKTYKTVLFENLGKEYKNDETPTHTRTKNHSQKGGGAPSRHCAACRLFSRRAHDRISYSRLVCKLSDSRAACGITCRLERCAYRCNTSAAHRTNAAE